MKENLDGLTPNKYRDLRRGEILQAGDETREWGDSIYVKLSTLLVGRTYEPYAHSPMRRPVPPEVNGESGVPPHASMEEVLEDLEKIRKEICDTHCGDPAFETDGHDFWCIMLSGSIAALSQGPKERGEG